MLWVNVLRLQPSVWNSLFLPRKVPVVLKKYGTSSKIILYCMSDS